MIIGVFRDNLPRLLITLHGERGEVVIEAILDTGFDGFLKLPEEVIRRLNPPFAQSIQVRLADGSQRAVPTFSVRIAWEEEIYDVEAIQQEGNVLLGTLLIDGCHVDLEATEGGELVIETL